MHLRPCQRDAAAALQVRVCQCWFLCVFVSVGFWRIRAAARAAARAARPGGSSESRMTARPWCACVQAAVRRSVSTPRLQQAARCRLEAIASRIEGRSDATRSWLARAFPHTPRWRAQPQAVGPCAEPAATGAPVDGHAEYNHGSEPSAADVSIETHRRVRALEELAASGARGEHLGSCDDDSEGAVAESPRPPQQAAAADGREELSPQVALAERERADLRCDSTVDALSSAASCPSMSAIWDRDLSFSSTDESRAGDLQQDAASWSSERPRECAVLEAATPPRAHDTRQASLSCESVDERSAAECPDARAADVGAMTDDRERESSSRQSAQLDTSAALSCTYTPPTTEHRGASQRQANSNGTDGAQEGAGVADDVVLRRMILQQELEWTRQALQSRKTHLKRSRLSHISPTVAGVADEQ